MADDLALAASVGPGSADKGASGRSPLLGKRAWLLVWAAVVALILAGALVVHAFWRPFLDVADARTYFIATTVMLWLPLVLLLLDGSDNLAAGPKLGLPLTTLAILVALAGFAATPFGSNELQSSSGAPRLAAAAAFMSFLALALAARVASALQFARAKRQDFDERQRLFASESDDADSELEERRRQNADAEAVGALVATLVVAAVIGGAYSAGRWSGDNGLQNAAGLAVSWGTIGLFLLLVFLDRLPDFPPVRLLNRLTSGASKGLGWLPKFYGFIDTALVRVGAHAVGMEHRHTRVRYALLAGTQASLCVMAWFLPAPLGLVPAAIGFVLALSVSRLWAWVEDDRALAVITRFNPKAPIKVGFREDYRDETLLAFSFVLVLIPIALRQAHTSHFFGGDLFVNAQVDQLGAWMGYLGFELIKALPVVDWADIYGFSEGQDVMKATRPLGMHVVFGARAMVDLVLISAVLQAITISSRNRQQKVLYAVRQIRRVDEIIERRELSRIVSRPEKNRFASDVLDFSRYEPERLNDIRNTTHDPRIKLFVESILSKSGRGLEDAIQVLVRLSANRAPVGELRTL